MFVREERKGSRRERRQVISESAMQAEYLRAYLVVVVVGCVCRRVEVVKRGGFGFEGEVHN